MKSARTLSVAAILWLSLATFGFWVFSGYERNPGGTGAVPLHWPKKSAISPGPRFTLLMFAHPKCPCSRASIGELNRLLAHCNEKVSATVLMFEPSSMPKDWAHGGLWDTVAKVPGVSVIGDPDGMEARRFGAETSGFTLLYDSKGDLLFKGGLTAARAHEGETVAARKIAAIVSGQNSIVIQSPVFGCGLLDRQSTIGVVR